MPQGGAGFLTEAGVIPPHQPEDATWPRKNFEL